MIIDTHSHIYEPEFDEDRELVVQRAKDAGIEYLILPAIDKESYERLFSLCRNHSNYVIPMMGLHPTSINENNQWKEDLALVKAYLDNTPEGIPSFCAVGEIGLDFYWDRNFIKEQTMAFEQQIEWALEKNLPICVHTRDAWKEMIDSISKFKGRGLNGIFHAFSDTLETYQELKKYGNFKFGVGGVVTFKKSKIAEVVKEMDLSDLVIETDCPYLTPVPFRGQRNESSYVRYVAEKISELKGITYEEVARITTLNAKQILKIQ